MAGVAPLPIISRLAGHSSSCGIPAGLIFRSGTSSSACAGLQGLRDGTRDVTRQQLHSNGTFRASLEKWHTVQNSKRTERLSTRSQTIDTAETEQKQEGSTATTSTTSPEVGEDTKLSGSLEHPFAHLLVGDRWREYQGSNRWEGLLDPLDNVLAGELIRYGEYTQAMYDSFDFDTNSRFCGSCKYGRARLLEKVGLGTRGYEVTDYLYCTAGEGIPFAQYFKFTNDKVSEEEGQEAWSRESNWTGFVAVTTDPKEIKRLGRRDIVVAWRGTLTKLEWAENFQDYTVPSGLDPRESGQKGRRDVKFEAGFLRLYTAANPKSPYTKKSARRQLLEAIVRLLKKYPDEDLSITVTGHSLGAALALVAAYDIAESGVNQASKLPKDIPHWDNPDPGTDPDQVVEWTLSDEVKTVPVTAYTYGGPRVGNDAFRDRTEELGVKVLRVVNKSDIVPLAPGLFFNEKLDFLERFTWLWSFMDGLPFTYSHVGVALEVDSSQSPYLKKKQNRDNVHNLEGYLHVISGFHTLGGTFDQVIVRDHALVNKSSDFLDIRVPDEWFQEANKGLVLNEDGRYVPRPREEVDYPEYDLDDRHAGDDSLPANLSSIK